MQLLRGWPWFFSGSPISFSFYFWKSKYGPLQKLFWFEKAPWASVIHLLSLLVNNSGNKGARWKGVEQFSWSQSKPNQFSHIAILYGCLFFKIIWCNLSQQSIFNFFFYCLFSFSLVLTPQRKYFLSIETKKLRTGRVGFAFACCLLCFFSNLLEETQPLAHRTAGQPWLSSQATSFT